MMLQLIGGSILGALTGALAGWAISSNVARWIVDRQVRRVRDDPNLVVALWLTFEDDKRATIRFTTVCSLVLGGVLSWLGEMWWALGAGFAVSLAHSILIVLASRRQDPRKHVHIGSKR